MILSMDSPRRKKRLEFDDDDDNDDDADSVPEQPAPKRSHRDPQLCPAPCQQPLLRPPEPTSDAPAAFSRLGPYVLLEAQEGGRAYRAMHCPTNTEYMCKVYPAASYRELLSPYAHLPRHPHVAPVVEAVLGQQHVYVFFPRAHGDMHSYVRERRRVPEREAASLFLQMAQAVAHCHQHNLVLRDLKLRKFVFVDRERTKLALENLEDSCLLSGPDDSLWDKHGCPAYVGPEILTSRDSYSGKAADVWSLGVALYTMLAGRYPFQDTAPALLFGKIRRGAFALPEGLSTRARCLVRCLLRREPSERLTAQGILLHPWLQGGGDLCEEAGIRGAEQVVPDSQDPEEEVRQETEELLYS
ncbi:tribbles homolog 3 [Gracilinanus agilis]|uniref:tribbles homolog 3 n=1 Tax=Gracilinanus agilis TaxID=191870 RepID=UPI001CFE812C|nr:tribbles homolog 3 [Gracilinanus agilis]XP_044520223.1 tribbles homolog 3 [Gracilinanus agilis]